MNQNRYTEYEKAVNQFWNALVEKIGPVIILLTNVINRIERGVERICQKRK